MDHLLSREIRRSNAFRARKRAARRFGLSFLLKCSPSVCGTSRSVCLQGQKIGYTAPFRFQKLPFGAVFVYNLSMWQEVRQLNRRDQSYLAGVTMLLLPPLLFSLGVARGIFWRDDALTFAVVGSPGNDVLRSFLFVLACPTLAAFISFYYLIKHPSVHAPLRRLSIVTLAGCLLFVVAMVIYLLLENF
jgi:hypothetical protein